MTHERERSAEVIYTPDHFYLPPISVKTPLVVTTPATILRGNEQLDKEKIPHGYVVRGDPPRFIKASVWVKDDLHLHSTGVFQSSEDITRELLKAQRGRLLGDGFLLQMTTQGRLPDEFKYAAISMLLSSPRSRNWEQPFYDAPWGRVSPLIHDGGNADYSTNEFWQNVPGRTDFLSDMISVCAPYSQEEAQWTEWIKHRLDSYQLLAFGIHSKTGNTPDQIPESIKQHAANGWREFVNRMKYLLDEYDLLELHDTSWFLQQPRKLPGWETFGERYEADFAPIKHGLLKLEEQRKAFPDLSSRAANTLQGYRTFIRQALEKIVE